MKPIAVCSFMRETRRVEVSGDEGMKGSEFDLRTGVENPRLWRIKIYCIIHLE